MSSKPELTFRLASRLNGYGEHASVLLVEAHDPGRKPQPFSGAWLSSRKEWLNSIRVWLRVSGQQGAVKQRHLGTHRGGSSRVAVFLLYLKPHCHYYSQNTLPD